jgi:integrase/recombinase XerD
MNTLREAVQSYLALRRGLGFKLLLAGNALQDFVTFMEKRRAVHITLRRVLQWAQQPKYAHWRRGQHG